jgi:Uma2 family endonuclease
MATDAKRWTVEEVRALPEDGRRYELVDGELLVTPAPWEMTPAPTWRHGDAVRALFRRFDAWLEQNALGDVRFAPAAVSFDDRSVVEPDLFVVPLVGGQRPRSWDEAGRLLLAVEVLSPGSARADRVIKRALYQRAGVPEYWIVFLDARLVERWRPGDDRPEILEQRLEWRPDPAQPPFVLDLPAFFAEVIGE